MVRHQGRWPGYQCIASGLVIRDLPFSGSTAPKGPPLATPCFLAAYDNCRASPPRSWCRLQIIDCNLQRVVRGSEHRSARDINNGIKYCKLAPNGF